jgi:hypothetical protein
MLRSTALVTSIAALAFVASCGNQNASEKSSSVQELPSKDPGVAAFRTKFATARKIANAASVDARTWKCALFSAMKDISHNAGYSLQMESFGSTLVTYANYNTNGRELQVVGSLNVAGGKLIGSSTGRNDRFVLPNDPLEQEVRMAADGSLVIESFTHGDAMVVDERNGLALATLAARMWMEPAVSNSSKFVFQYSVCK